MHLLQEILMTKDNGACFGGTERFEKLCLRAHAVCVEPSILKQVLY